jgi:hypothetical protein
LPRKSKAKFWEINFSIFMEKFQGCLDVLGQLL